MEPNDANGGETSREFVFRVTPFCGEFFSFDKKPTNDDAPCLVAPEETHPE
ncbi:MAG: hypothetical protein ABW189_06765 [Rickettsiales bacterium]